MRSKKSTPTMRLRSERQEAERFNSEASGKLASIGRRISKGRVPMRGIDDVKESGNWVKAVQSSPRGGDGHLYTVTI